MGAELAGLRMRGLPARGQLSQREPKVVLGSHTGARLPARRCVLGTAVFSPEAPNAAANPRPAPTTTRSYTGPSSG
jgi:hypothetical protein